MTSIGTDMTITRHAIKMATEMQALYRCACDNIHCVVITTPEHLYYCAGRYLCYSCLKKDLKVILVEPRLLSERVTLRQALYEGEGRDG